MSNPKLYKISQLQYCLSYNKPVTSFSLSKEQEILSIAMSLNVEPAIEEQTTLSMVFQKLASVFCSNSFSSLGGIHVSIK